MATPVPVNTATKPPVKPYDATGAALMSSMDGPAPTPTGIPAPVATAPAPAPTATPRPVSAAANAPAPVTAPAAAPAAPMDPNQALNQIGTTFQSKFGRAMSPEEQQALIQSVGYTSGPVSPEMMKAALDTVGRYSGDLKNPWAPVSPASPLIEPTPATPVVPPSETLAETQLQNLLSTEKWGEVDPNSAGMQGQRDAFGLAAQRDATRRRAALAERAAARGGLGAGGYDVDTERIISEQGEKEQAFESDLYAKELSGQRERLMQAIQMARQFGLQDEARKLQEKLGTLDLNLRQYLGKGQLGLGLLNAGQQNQQYYDSLGLNYATLQNLMNNQAINAIL